MKKGDITVSHSADYTRRGTTFMLSSAVSLQVVPLVILSDSVIFTTQNTSRDLILQIIYINMLPVQFQSRHLGAQTQVPESRV